MQLLEDDLEALRVSRKQPRSTTSIEEIWAEPDADIAHVLTMDEARLIASNIAKLPAFPKDRWAPIGGN